MALLDCNPLQNKPCQIGDLAGVLVGTFQLLLALAVLVSVFFIVLGGIRMAAAWFAEAPPDEFKDGWNTVRRSIFGLILVIGAFLIVETLLLLVAGPERGINHFFQQIFST